MRLNELFEPDLPMDKASRFKRAEEMSFDTSRVLYHGTDQDFHAFKVSPKGAYGPGIYLTDNARMAHQYAIKNGTDVRGHIMPVFIRKGKYASFDELTRKHIEIDRRRWWGGYQSNNTVNSKTVAILKKHGFLGLDLHGIILVFDPANIRSVNAVFDPAKDGSANILEYRE